MKTKRKKKQPKKSGAQLFDQVIRLTGIPSKSISKELIQILEKRNIDVKQLTVEQLRSAVASYVREIMLSILDKHGPKDSELH